MKTFITFEIKYGDNEYDCKTHDIVVTATGNETIEQTIELFNTKGFWVDKVWISPYRIMQVQVKSMN